VQETRADDDEGRHTTSHRELIELPGGGAHHRHTRPSASSSSGTRAGSTKRFADVEELAAECRFNDCSHGTEPGCAVNAALAAGTLTHERYGSWRKLQRELRAIAVRADARLRREEKREKWQLRAREGRARARRL